MKKLFLILTTALFAAGFASCTDDPEETVNPVVVSEILRALGGNVLVNVPEENFDVNIPADAAFRSMKPNLRAKRWCCPSMRTKRGRNVRPS